MQKVINLGKTIQIVGELTGSEDLTIEGKLEGKIFLRDHNLTIGENGDIKADIQAKGVVVAGKLVGNITADDRVEVALGGAVKGNIKAPRVALAEGCQFRGSVDMDSGARSKADSAASTTGTDRRAEAAAVAPKSAAATP
jgi:cytoskeletal protein CcmA (bactofilin family)